MLTAEEKEALYHVIRSVIGEDPTIRAYKPQFNERTVEEVEKMMLEESKCNANMKDLVQDLVGGSKAITKGWLKKLLAQGHKLIKNSGNWKGGGCKNIIHSKWRTAIINSAI